VQPQPIFELTYTHKYIYTNINITINTQQRNKLTVTFVQYLQNYTKEKNPTRDIENKMKESVCL